MNRFFMRILPMILMVTASGLLQSMDMDTRDTDAGFLTPTYVIAHFIPKYTDNGDIMASSLSSPGQETPGHVESYTGVNPQAVEKALRKEMRRFFRQQEAQLIAAERSLKKRK